MFSTRHTSHVYCSNRSCVILLTHRIFVLNNNALDIFKVQIIFGSYHDCYRYPYQDHGTLVHYLTWSNSIKDFA